MQSNCENREKKRAQLGSVTAIASSSAAGPSSRSLPGTFLIDEAGEYEIFYSNSGSPSLRRRVMRNRLCDFRNRG
eukprot:IDg4484t1